MEKQYDIAYGENPYWYIDLLVASPCKGSLSSLDVWFLSPMDVDDGRNKNELLKKVGFYKWRRKCREKYLQWREMRARELKRGKNKWIMKWGETSPTFIGKIMKFLSLFCFLN
jgi:hypothetical protein